MTTTAMIASARACAVAAGTILRRVILAVAVDFRTILGAISVYTLQGLLFSYLFLALGRLSNGDVFAASGGFV